MKPIEEMAKEGAELKRKVEALEFVLSEKDVQIAEMSTQISEISNNTYDLNQYITKLEEAVKQIYGYADECIKRTMKKSDDDTVHESHVHFVTIRNMCRAALSSPPRDKYKEALHEILQYSGGFGVNLKKIWDIAYNALGKPELPSFDDVRGIANKGDTTLSEDKFPPCEEPKAGDCDRFQEDKQ